MTNDSDDLYSFNGPPVDTSVSYTEGPDESANYNDFRLLEKWSLNYNGTLLLLPDNDKCPPKWKGRLLAFKGMTLSWSILPRKTFRSNDEVNHVWIENNELWASSSAGFRYKIDLETGAILESSHSHWDMQI